MRVLAASVFLLMGFAAALSAHAQVLYKYVDEKGRVTYSNEPPGPGDTRSVTRIEASPQTNVVESARPNATTARIAAKLAERDSKIDQLKAEVEAARKRLAETEAARDGGKDVRDDERQWTISRPDPGAKPDKDGKLPGRNGTVTCQIRTAPDGEKRAFCPPIPVPNEAYYERQNKLNQAVADARRALEDAEHDARRNTPD